MIEFINKRSGRKFYVTESRKDEYLAAGHKLAVKVAEKVEEKPEPKKAIKKK